LIEKETINLINNESVTYIRFSTPTRTHARTYYNAPWIQESECAQFGNFMDV